MNKLLRYGIFAIWCVVLLTIVSVSEGRAQDPTREILRRMDAHNQALQTLVSDITMVKYDAALKITEVSAGNIRYLPKKTKGKMAFRLDWATEDGRPKEESMSLIGDKAVLYQPRQNLAKEGKSQKSKTSEGLGSALAFLSMSKAEVNANYDIVYLGDEQIKTGQKTWHLQLTPKSQTSNKVSEIWVDSDGMPRQIKVVNKANNDYHAVLLSNIQKNVKLDLSTFEIKYKPGTKVQPF
jgi:outer membrane lipoprotein-sorting protein